MKKIVMVIVAVALIAAGVFGTLAVQRTFEPSISLSSTSIQEQLSDCSELATAKLDYRGLVRYENGDIDFITKKAFTMVYDAEGARMAAWIWRRPASRSAATPSR